MKRRELVGRMAALASGGLLLNSASAHTGYTGTTATDRDGGDPATGSDGGADYSPMQSYGPVFDVRKYGAKGDGKTNDRLAIQKAIDACAKAGGGTVLLDKGVFMSGGIKMKSHVELHLSSNAVLMGVTGMDEYNHDTNFPQGGGIRSLINAEDCEHIAITGRGKIDGQGHLFTHTRGYSFRPYLVYFRRCRNIHICDIQLYNSAVWVCWLLRCERVKIDGMKADNPVSPNRDGIDIDGCKDVTISNCIFKTEDDSIAFKVSEKGYPTRDVVVTNCIISSRCAAIRFGPDAIDNIENVTVSNCVITDTRLNGIKIQESMGAVMRNLTFSNIVMDNVRGPISMRVAGWLLKADEPAPFEINDTAWEQGNLQNILFNNIQGVIPKDNICMSITGTSKTRPQQITFSNIDFTFAGGGTAEQGARREVPDLDRHYPEMYIFGELPAYALYMHHVSGVVMQNVQFRLAEKDLRPAIVCDDVDDLELSGVRLAGDKQAESVIRLQNSGNVFINTSSTLNPTGAFLRVEGARCRDIFLSGNKLNKSDKPVHTTGEVSADAVTVK